MRPERKQSDLKPPSRYVVAYLGITTLCIILLRILSETTRVYTSRSECGMDPLLNYALRVIVVTFLSQQSVCWALVLSSAAPQHFRFLTSQIDSLKLNRLRGGAQSVEIRMIYRLLSCYIMWGVSVRYGPVGQERVVVCKCPLITPSARTPGGHQDGRLV